MKNHIKRTSVLLWAILKIFKKIYLNIEQSNTNINVKIVSEYDQELPQSQTADNPVAPRGRAAQPSRDTRKTN